MISIKSWTVSGLERQDDEKHKEGKRRMFDNLESLATAVAILGGVISAVIALLGIYREWVWSKREKAEKLLTSLVDEIGGQVLEIEDEFGWNMIHDQSGYPDVAQNLTGDRRKLFDRKVRRLLQKLETMAIRIKHNLLDEEMFRDYFLSIAKQAVTKNNLILRESHPAMITL